MNTGNPGNYNDQQNVFMKQSRRVFIKTASAGSAGAILSPGLFSNSEFSEARTHPLCVFTKCLQFLDYEQLGEALSLMGFKGADLSVRDGGHVLPENVKTDLPRAVKILHKSGIQVPMMVTGIISAEDPLTETILGTASDLGIGYYRMGYLSYDPAKSITENLEIHKKAFDRLEKVNRKFGIQGCYQNHSGARVGGPVWDIYWLVKDCDPESLGVQYDILHAVVEGAESWSLGMKLLSPWIKTAAIKDFYWKKQDGKWKRTYVPLGEGMIDFDAYLREYTSLGISGPVTIHYEYDLGGAQSGSGNPTMSLKEISGYMSNDLKWLKNKFNEHGILSSFS
jgi:L-ribulose-5-phosphate 3-epimerase